jgi:serine/threonine-protein kinase
LEQRATLKTVQQKYCTTCGMPLILNGRYLPERLLGQGGFGAAFLARDRYTPTLRPCVVKLFLPSSQLSAQQLQVAQTLFEREAEVLEQLGNQHPQIPDLYAFFPLVAPGPQANSTAEFFYLVQEFIDGEDLEQILNRRGAFPEKAVKAVLISILKVLSFVHANGAIHRDIKPSNIMKACSGELYLLDFGAVKQVTGPVASQSTGIYTAGYAPPELAAGGAVYPSSDLYSLAVTAIVLLTGKDPTDLYDGYANRWQWQSQVSVQDDVLIAVLNRMLQPTPSQRYGSAEEALQALLSPGAASNQSAPAVAPVTPPVRVPAPSPVSGPVSGPVAAPTAAPVWLRPLPEFLGGMAFMGFEGSLLAIGTASLLGTTWLGSGVWLVLLIGLIALQLGRVIERVDLVLIAAATLVAVVLLVPLPKVLGLGATWLTVVVLAMMAALALVAIATLFRLVYQLLSRLL